MVNKRSSASVGGSGLGLGAALVTGAEDTGIFTAWMRNHPFPGFEIKGRRMKTSYMNKKLKQFIADQYAGYACVGKEAVKVPIQWFIRGFSFEGTAYSKTTCYLWAFSSMVLPPRETVSFQFGRRIGSFDLSEETEPTVGPSIIKAVEDKGISTVEALCTPEDLIGMRLTEGNGGDFNKLETLAHAYIIAGDPEMAYKSLVQAIPLAESHILEFPKVSWSRECKNRLTLLRDLLDREPEEAMEKLKEWRMFTLRSLKLESHAAEL